jgi:signal transduction histidine kinase
VSQTQLILEAQHVDILFLYADGLRVEISSNSREIGRFIPPEKSISGLVLSRGEAVLANDIQDDPLLRDRYFPRVEMDPEALTPRLSVLVADLTFEGETIGVINVEASPDRNFDQSHLDFVKTMARQISVAIAHATLFDEDNLRTTTDKLLLADTGLDNEVIMRQVLEQVLRTLNSLTFLKPDAAEILYEHPQDNQALVVAYSTNSADTGVRVDIASSVCGEAFRRRETVLLNRAEERREYRPILEGMRCEMAIPIILGGSSQFPIGVLNLESKRVNAFSNVGQILAERFSRRVVNALAMTKIRADLDAEMQDQLMVLAADQVLNAVHRINNHIGAIRGHAKSIREDLESGIPVDRGEFELSLRLIEENAELALEIPNELRKRIGALEESLDLNAQVEAGLDAVKIPRNIGLVKDLAARLPDLPCTALDLVVENLLLNAIEAMRSQGGTLSVSTWIEKRSPREAFIVVTVADNGIGMTKNQLDSLFKPRPPGTRGRGLGFGMLWVRGWVRRSQGLLDVDSAPGSGTTVNIRFQIDPEIIHPIPKEDESA